MFARRLAVVALLAGCGGGAGGAGGTTWSDGTTFTEAVEIPAGETVTIAPGAKVTVAAKVAITVRGTLKVASATGAHAKLTGAWTGLVVEAGGTLAADGLDLDGAETALDVRSTTARWDHGVITNALFPIDVKRGARLDTDHGKVVAAKSSSGVTGTLHATYLDYDKIDTTGGFSLLDKSAVLELVDSTLHGTPGTVGADYITTLGGAALRISYSTINDSHCAIHLSGVDHFELDHVTFGARTPTGERNLNAWGGMLYGFGPGASFIKDSNFVNSSQNFDQQGTNGPLTITNTYTTGANIQNDVPWPLAGAEVAASPVLDAQPR
jgi:hypothetical protein